MKLPGLENAVISSEKITGYLLSPTHPNGRHKALFFTRFGFSIDTWEEFADALRQHAGDHYVAKVENSPFGTRYVIDGEILSPDRRNPLIRSVWFRTGNATKPYFVTAYPL